MAGLTTVAEEKTSISRKTWIIPLGLFTLALVIRLLYAAQITFPPLDDPAYYVQGARSIREGHPFEMAIVWNYHPMPAAVMHLGFDFWMPMTSFLIAASFTLFGDTMLASQLPSVICGALLATLTFYLAQRALARVVPAERNRLILSSLSGLYIAINPLLCYQSAVPDSQMIYAALVGGALLVWIGGESLRRAFLFGLLLGLAYITRSHAVFLGLAWFGVALWQLWRRRGQRKEVLIRAILTIAGLALVAGPWVLRTWLTFKFINSPAGLESALIYDYATLFNVETPINFNTFLALGPGKILEARGIALFNAWVEVLGVMFFPTVLLPAIGLGLLWRKTRILGPAILYCLLLSLGLPLIFVAASSTGSFYHSSGSMAPVVAIGYVYLLWRLNEWYRQGRKGRLSIFPLLIGVLCLFEIFQLAVTLPATSSVHNTDREVYARLDQWLKANPAGQAVIADEPSSFNYATGLPALRLPSDEPLDVVQRVADRYQARYIIVTGNFGRYPQLLQSPDNTRFPLAYKDPQGQFEIYRVVQGKP
ncbi:MAG TPA: hypothetical protein VH186_30210 [Chloroflexia bacterium]|nr:hypothetical protein [Chloroflexia bacterium]